MSLEGHPLPILLAPASPFADGTMSARRRIGLVESSCGQQPRIQISAAMERRPGKNSLSCLGNIRAGGLDARGSYLLWLLGLAAGRSVGGSRHIPWCWLGTRMICTIHHRKVRAALMSSCRAPVPPAAMPIAKSRRPNAKARGVRPRSCRGEDSGSMRAEVYPEPSDHISTRQLNSGSAVTVEVRFQFDCGVSATSISCSPLPRVPF
jgi:hypothetical protein